MERNILEQNLQKTIELSDKISDAVKWGNWATIEVTLKSRFKQNPGWLFILVRDKNGEIVISTDETLNTGVDSSYLPEFDMDSSKIMIMSSDPWEGIQRAIHYQSTTIIGDIVHTNDIIGSAGETIFDAYIQILRDDEIVGSIRVGFSRRALIKDIRQLQLFLVTTEIIALLFSFFLVIAAFGNTLKALTELSRELSKISYVDNPNDLLSQLQTINIDRINVKTRELKELKSASLRFQQQLVLNIEQSEKYSHMEMHARKMEAIAKTTQMLAHDIRKPFSMILMIMQSLQACTDPKEIQIISKKFLPEVQSAITAANDMIYDVMQIDRALELKKEPTDPLVVIKNSLREIFRIHSMAQIDICYDFSHRHFINADALKLQRVFSNIFSNAVQAMNKKGILRISTRENRQKKVITFCIENDGAYLPEDELSKVFDAFYTKYKEKGTGLGLAICQKIIMTHGGEVWCESSPSEMVVQFYFTIPIAAGMSIDTSSFDLPEYLNELSEDNTIQSIAGSNSRQLSLEKKIYQYVVQNDRKIELCILDDELFYQNVLVKLIKTSKQLGRSINILLAGTQEEVIALFTKNTPDLLVCDIDLGPNCPNGFQVVRELRKRGFTPAVCIHSNRSFSEEYRGGIGTHVVLPKPMSLEHLTQFIVNSIHVDTK